MVLLVNGIGEPSCRKYEIVLIEKEESKEETKNSRFPIKVFHLVPNDRRSVGLISILRVAGYLQILPQFPYVQVLRGDREHRRPLHDLFERKLFSRISEW